MKEKKKQVADKATQRKSQRERFIEAARKAGVSEQPEAFDRAFSRVVLSRPRPKNRDQ